MKAVLLAMVLAFGQLQGAGTGYATVRGWSLPSGNCVGYNLYAALKADGEYRKVNVQPITGLQYVLPGLSPGWRYYFKLTQLVGQPPQESAKSQPFSLVALAGPAPAAEAAPGQAVAPAAEAGQPMKGLGFEEGEAVEVGTMKTFSSSTIKAELVASQKHSGQRSLHVESMTNLGSTTIVTVLGLQPPDCPFQVARASALKAWVYSEKKTTLAVGFREGLGNGADGGSWLSPYKFTVGKGWEQISFPLVEFQPFVEKRNGYAIKGNMTARHEINLHCVLEFQFWTKNGKSEFYLDDISFE